MGFGIYTICLACPRRGFSAGPVFCLTHFLTTAHNFGCCELWALSMEQPQSEKILEPEQSSSDHIMKIHNEENNLSDLMANIDQQQHRSGLAPTTTSEQQSSSVSADSGNSTAGNSESMLPEIDAKERLQRFDLVIQHLHRLRATLALDSSVRELQKLQTLNILGQNLLQPQTQTHGHHAGPPELKQLLHAQQHSSSHSVPVPQPPGHHGKSTCFFIKSTQYKKLAPNFLRFTY